MDAMVLAAGLGTRMRIDADAPPKPLTMLDGRSLIMRMLDRLADARCARIIVNLHFGREAIYDHLTTHEGGWTRAELIFSYEYDAPLETGGGVKHALSLLTGEHFVVANCDSIWQGGHDELARLIESFDPQAMDALLMLAHGGHDFTMDVQAHLTRGEGFTYAGVQILQRALFDDSPKTAFSLNHLYDKAIARGRLYGLMMAAQWLHVGTPAQLATARNALKVAAAQNALKVAAARNALKVKES